MNQIEETPDLDDGEDCRGGNPTTTINTIGNVCDPEEGTGIQQQAADNDNIAPVSISEAHSETEEQHKSEICNSLHESCAQMCEKARYEAEDNGMNELIRTPSPKSELYAADETVRAINAAQKIVASMKSLKKTRFDCQLCTDSSITLTNKEDLIKCYGAMLSCVSFHIEEMKQLDWEALFTVETHVLSYFQLNTNNKDFNSFFDGSEDDSSFTKRLEIYQAYYEEPSIKINCEQEIESLMYRVYKAMDTEAKKSLRSRDYELLLVLLFKREECVRFFRLFEARIRTEAMVRLALAFTLNEKCHVCTESVFKRLEDISFDADSYFNTGKPCFELLSDIAEEMGLMNCIVKEASDNLDSSCAQKCDTQAGLCKADTASKASALYNMQEWLESKRKEVEWNECVRVWCSNDRKDDWAMNKSMIDICIQYHKYEQGWIMFTRGCKKTSYTLHKACLLCLNALKRSEEPKWVDRLLGLIEAAVSAGEEECLCLVANDILVRMADLSDSTRCFILKEFQEKTSRLDKNEKFISCLLEGVVRLCQKCEGTETSASCACYANSIYSMWKGKRTENILGKMKGEFDAEIYSNMLCVCETAEDSTGFYKVCQDVASSHTRLSRDMCARLEKFHLKACANSCSGVDTQQGKELIVRIVNKG